MKIIDEMRERGYILKLYYSNNYHVRFERPSECCGFVVRGFSEIYSFINSCTRNCCTIVQGEINGNFIVSTTEDVLHCSGFHSGRHAPDVIRVAADRILKVGILDSWVNEGFELSFDTSGYRKYVRIKKGNSTFCSVGDTIEEAIQKLGYHVN